MTTATPTRVTGIELAADTLTPVAAALRLGSRCAFLLESVEGGARYGRYSIAGVHGRTLVVGAADGDPLEVLRAELPEVEPMGGDPAFPLASGVGYLAYEAAAQWERLPVPPIDPLGMPNAVFHLASSVIVFDHLAQVARVATLDGPGAQDRIDDVVYALMTPTAGEVPATFGAAVVPAERDMEARARYERDVALLVEEIHAGEMLQAVLARRFSVPTRRTAIEIYRSLRRINPSPYLYYLDLAAVSPATAVVGASPELLVRVRDGEVVTRPIAGTRPRHEDPGQDAALEAELRADPKELAEHAMLVDLARNDVGRVAAPASVEVTTLRDVERYTHVMHLVSEVHGRLADGLATVHAGAGIVADSVPEREAAEVAAKAASMLAAIGGDA